MIGDHSRIYDTRVRDAVGTLDGFDSLGPNLRTLGFLKQSTLLIASCESKGLILLNMEMVA